MKFKLAVIAILCSCTTPRIPQSDTNPAKGSVAKLPRLPIVLRVWQVPEDLQSLFRTQVIARGIDTMDLRAALKMTIDARTSVARSQGAAAADLLPAKCNMLMFGAVGNSESISRISWKAYPVEGRRPDTTSHYFDTPDSLRSQPARAILACLEQILISRILK